MGKNAHSKITKRLKALRRRQVEEKVVKPLTEQLSKKLECSITGIEYRVEAPKNGFLFPNDPAAVIPKHHVSTIVDLRSVNIPGSGLEYSGAYRKKKKVVVSDDSDSEGGDMEVEKVKAPIHKPIGKFVRTKKPAKRSKKIITF